MKLKPTAEQTLVITGATGGTGLTKAHSSMALNTPRAYDKFNELILNSAQNSGESSPANPSDGLSDTNSKLKERGAQERYVRESSGCQQANLHPLVAGAPVVGGRIALASLMCKSKANNN